MGRPTRLKTKSPESATETLGRVVREQRRALGLTQEDLSASSGVGLAFLYQLEHGKPTVRIDKVLEVLRTLGLSVSLRIAQPAHPAGTIRSEIPVR